MNNYTIYIEDTTNGKAIELDSTDVDFSTTFTVADVKDLLIRRDVITKDLTFKFSEVNNKAFGFAFMANRYIDESGDAPILGGNYNPQLIVPCSVYENGMLVLKGNLRLKSVKKNSYECVITGNVIEFTSTISEALLSDIDLTDLKHTYDITTISSTWSGTKEYVYPAIQYGVPFKNSDLLNVVNPFNILNFQPAVFVKSIFKRIFDNAGFRYEIKGNTQFLEIFNKLIIPNSRKNTTTSIIYEAGGAQIFIIRKISRDDRNNERVINADNMVAVALRMDASIVQTELFTRGAAFAFNSNAQTPRSNSVVFNVNKSFTAAAKFSYSVDFFYRSNAALDMHVQLVSRAVINADANEYHNFNGWDTEYEDVYRLPYVQDTTTRTREFVIPSVKYEVGKQYMLRAYFYIVNGGVSLGRDILDYAFTQAEVSFPSLVGQSVEVDTVTGGQVIPMLPTGVKQLDFINSISSLFNLYKYTDADDDKKIIFEPYDSYYSLAGDGMLVTSAKDWTNYIDYDGDYSNDSNLDIPKNYNFKWKNDKDFLNTTYQDKYNASYGDLQITDSRGITDKKEISLIFSPTPMAGGYSTTGTPYFGLPVPYIYGVNNGEIQNIDSNIRLLIYNGNTISTNYNIISESFNNYTGVWNTNITAAGILPIANNFLYDANQNALFDLHFGQPKEVFFLKDAKYDLVKYSYSQYTNQIEELKSANVTYLTCQMYLNPAIINQLDLKKPVYLDLGRHGTSYWKVLSVNYTNSVSKSTVKLQKIT